MRMTKDLQFSLIFLLLCVVVTAESLYQTCNPIQWLQRAEEEQLRSDIAQRESFIFAEDQLIFKIIDFVSKKSAFLGNMLRDMCKFLIRFNIGYVLTLALILACFIGYPSAKKHYKTSFLAINEISKQKMRKAMAVLLCILCFFAFAQALRGVDQSEKVGKSLNEVYCKLLEQPKGLIRGLNGTADIGYDAFMRHVDIIEDVLVPNQHKLQKSLYNLDLAEYYLNITSAVIDNLIKNKEGSDFFKEFNQSVSDLSLIYSQFKSQQILLRHHEQYDVDQLRQSWVFKFKTAQKYLEFQGKQYFSIVQVTCILCKAFFFSVASVSIIIASFIIYDIFNKEKVQTRQNVVLWMQMVLCTFISVCFIFCLVNSFILILSGTTHSTLERISTSPELFLEQLSGLTFKADQYGIFLLAPFNLTHSSLDNGRYMRLYTHDADFFAPYATRLPTFFYDILSQSLSYIKDESFKEETIAVMRMNERALKEPFAAHFKTIHQCFKNYLPFVEPNGIYDRMDSGAVGGIVLRAARTFTFLMANRSFSAHEICGRLSISLSLILLLASMKKEELISETGNAQAVSMIEMQDKGSGQQPRDTASIESVVISR